MKIKLTIVHFLIRKGILLTIMRTLIFLVCTTVFSFNTDKMFSQEKVTIDSDIDVSIDEIFFIIQNQTDYRFLYPDDLFVNSPKVHLKKGEIEISELLKKSLEGSNVSYQLSDNNIIVIKRPTASINSNKIQNQQKFRVNGKITDNLGQPLPGANILERGTTNGVTTDFDGNFNIEVSDGNTILVISYLGFLTQEIEVNNRTSIAVVLQEDSAKLDEVVLVGYGTQKVTNLTGSVAVVNEEAIENRPTNNVSNLLAGTGAGITVVNTGGQPGNDESSISIRGNTTFGGSNAPLIIVDGIEASLDNIDPNDIESMSVLKDASSSAIYGVRGGNGVIVVKTKRGKLGKVLMKFNTSVGFQEFTFLPNFVNSFDYATLRNEALLNDGLTPEFDASQLQGYQNGTLPNTDWIDAISSESGFSQRYYFSLSGGTEKLNYLASLGYLDSEGLISNSNYKRYNLRVNIDQKVNDKFSVAYNLALSRRDALEPASSARTVFFDANRSIPTAPILNSDGNYVGINGQFNAVATAELSGTRSSIYDEFIGGIKASYELVKGLTFTNISAITQAYRNANNWRKYYQLYDENGSPTLTFPNGVEVNTYRQLDTNIQNLLSYENSFDKHNLKILLGHNAIRSDLKGTLTSIKELPENNTSDEIALGNPETLVASSVVEGNRLESYFGRLNYDFDEKYLFELSFRRDATSRFAPENRKEFFPSFSLGWNLAKEQFFNVKDINSLKLRGSWGQLGNQDITNFAYSPIYVRGRDLWLGGITQNSLIEGSSNPDLTWETITKTNFGLDATLFDYKLSLTADYFIEKREDILALEPLPGTFGAEAPLANIGGSSAEGIEVNLNYRGVIGNEFKYGANVNFTYFTKTPTVEDLSENAELPGRSNGDPISNIFGYSALGLFQSTDEIMSSPDQTFFGGTPVPGDIRYSDINGDGIVDSNDRISLGTYAPGLFYGISLNGDYKEFDLSLLFQGVGKVKNALSTHAAHPFASGGGALERHLDRWTPTNTNASYPVLHAVNAGRNENYVNSFFVYDASYMRLKNIQLGYTLPQNITDKIGLDKLRIYFSAENLLTFVNSEYPDGFDPEAISTFVFNQEFGGDIYTPITPSNDGTVYPQTKNFTLGINIEF